MLLAAAMFSGCASQRPLETATLEMFDGGVAMSDNVQARDAVYRTEAKPERAPEADPDIDPDALLKLGPGDAITVNVFGRPEMSTTTYVSDQGDIEVPLVGTVQVAGLTPAKAAQRVSWALRDGQYLLNPHVSITLSAFRSQQVSVLGEVLKPGRFSIESRTTPLDLLAQAGGPSKDAATVIYVLRPDGKGNTARYVVDLSSLSGDTDALPQLALRGGDSIYVPKAEQFYIYGEVRTPNMYKLEPGMNVIQAIARGGGITPRGSERRIEISRHTPEGKLVKIDAEPTDEIQPNDVIRVKERLF